MIGNLTSFSDIERQLLFNRGITNEKDAEAFLNADGTVYDPFLLKDMSLAADQICEAIRKKQMIIVFGDYDVDGVTATALLVQLIRKLNGEVEHYIPDRFEEGYGFSEESIQGVLRFKPDLIITVDCGVRSIKEIDFMNQAGVDIIVTDHHQPLTELPRAAAILNPKQPGDGYPFKELAGVGLAFKLAQAVAFEFHELKLNQDDWLDLVALGTIADLAPLVGENRILVRRGLEIINSARRPGIWALIQVCGLKPGKIISQNVGFMLGPRLNAAGRLSTAENAYHLLLSEEPERALELAKALDEENRDRQSITKEIQVTIEKQEDELEEDDKLPLLFYCGEFNEGVVGLAASRLVEKYYRPAIVGTYKENLIRASCRSIPEFNITSALDECADLLEKHGGHAMAAGFTIKAENKDVFFKRMIEVFERDFDAEKISPKFYAGAEVDLNELQPELINFIERLEPTGMGNPYPLIISKNVKAERIKPIGKDGTHLRMIVSKSSGRKGIDYKNITFDAVAFNFGFLSEELHEGDIIDLLYAFETNEYNGRLSLQLNVKDIHF